MSSTSGLQSETKSNTTLRWFACGSNSRGALAVDHLEDLNVFSPCELPILTPSGNPTPLDASLAKRQFACGGQHGLMALPVSSHQADVGCVLQWGMLVEDDNLNSNTNKAQIQPSRIHISQSPIESVVCGWESSFCIDKDGQLWSWLPMKVPISDPAQPCVRCHPVARPHTNPTTSLGSDDTSSTTTPTLNTNPPVHSTPTSSNVKEAVVEKGKARPRPAPARGKLPMATLGRSYCSQCITSPHLVDIPVHKGSYEGKTEDDNASRMETHKLNNDDHHKVSRSLELSSLPQPVHLRRRVMSVCAGYRHALAHVEESFTSSSGPWVTGIVGWGCNKYGQLGLDRSVSYVDLPIDLPWPTQTLKGKHNKILDIGTGWRFSVILDDQGCLYATGDNTQGQLLLPSLPPTQGESGSEVKNDHHVASTLHFGFGECGLPTHHEITMNEIVVRMSGEESGSNEEHALPEKGATAENQEVNTEKVRVLRFACGHSHVTAITNVLEGGKGVDQSSSSLLRDNSLAMGTHLLVWGRRTFGQYGDGGGVGGGGRQGERGIKLTTDGSEQRKERKVWSALRWQSKGNDKLVANIVDVACGAEHILVVVNDHYGGIDNNISRETSSGTLAPGNIRSVWAWGWDEHGNLGLGSEANEDSRSGRGDKDKTTSDGASSKSGGLVSSGLDKVSTPQCVQRVELKKGIFVEVNPTYPLPSSTAPTNQDTASTVLTSSSITHPQTSVRPLTVVAGGASSFMLAEIK